MARDWNLGWSGMTPDLISYQNHTHLESSIVWSSMQVPGPFT